MKYTFLLTACILCYTNCAFSKKTIIWENDGPKVKVKASGIFGKRKDSKLRGSKDAPIGTFARALAVDFYEFYWRPRWNFIGLGGAIIPFALESVDESALGIVETLAQKDAPSSSIVVFMNLYNLEINNYVVMTGKDVRKFCFIPFSSSIVCLIKLPYNKYEPKAKFKLQTMDTHISFPVSTSPILKDEPVALCSSTDGSSLFVAFKDSNKIRIYKTNELSKAFTTFKTVKDPFALKRSANGTKLVVAAYDKIQTFNIEQKIIPERTINLPPFFHPDKLVLCAKDASSFLVSSHGGATYFYENEEFIKIIKRTDTDISWSMLEQNILIGLPKKSTIAIYSTDDLEDAKTLLKFQKIKPPTSGKLYKIITLPTPKRGIVILDKRGALSRLYQKRQRWKKEIIINQPKPQ